jgi:hypothetical protein
LGHIWDILGIYCSYNGDILGIHWEMMEVESGYSENIMGNWRQQHDSTMCGFSQEWCSPTTNEGYETTNSSSKYLTGYNVVYWWMSLRYTIKNMRVSENRGCTKIAI